MQPRPQSMTINQIRKVFKQNGDENIFDDFIKKVSSGMLTLEQTIENLQEYFKKSQAQNKGKQLFKQFNLSKKSKTQLLISYLTLSKKKKQIVEKIKSLILEGHPMKVKMLLIQTLGEAEGNQRFEAIKGQIKKKSNRVVQNSNQLSSRNGLKIYKYPALVVQEKQSTKNVMVFGETGSGKSTLINAFANYILGVDSDDDFRYKVVIDGERVINSQTSEVNDYYVRSEKEKTVYRLIDTPGFGDTKGFATDEQTIEQIKLKLKELSSLHLIVFVLKSSLTRFNDYQRYVVLSVMNLFTKQCIPNVLFVLTFSDGGKSAVVDIIQDKSGGFGDYLERIKEPRFISINNSCIFQPIEGIKQMQWIETYLAMEAFFKKLNSINAIFLSKSVKYFNLQQTFATVLQEFHSKIQLVDICCQKIVNYLNQAIKIQEEMKKYENYQQSTRMELQQIPTKRPVLRCSNCLDKNCHLQCTEPSMGKHPSDPSTCNKIDLSGYCLVCKCHQANHSKKNFQVKTKQIKQKKIDQKKKVKYFELNNNLSPIQKEYNYAITRYQAGFKEMENKLQQLKKIKQKLEEKGVIQQKLFNKTKIKYVELIKNNQKQQIKLQRLKNQLIYLEESLRLDQLPKQKLSNFGLFLKNKQTQYLSGKETAKLYKKLQNAIKTIQNIFQKDNQISKSEQFYRVPSSNVLDHSIQTSHNLYNQDDAQKPDQKIEQCCLNKECCCSCIKCIFCCFFS